MTSNETITIKVKDDSTVTITPDNPYLLDIETECGEYINHKKVNKVKNIKLLM